jgi:hypothetical protein
MSHLKSTCLQLFLAIKSQKGTLHMECLFLHTLHVSFIRKNLYNQQLTLLRHFGTGNYLRVFSLTPSAILRPSSVHTASSASEKYWLMLTCLPGVFYMRVLLHSYDVPGCTLTAWTFWWSNEWIIRALHSPPCYVTRNQGQVSSNPGGTVRYETVQCGR